MSFMSPALTVWGVSRFAGNVGLHGMVLSNACGATGALDGSVGRGLPVSGDAACCNGESLRRGT